MEIQNSCGLDHIEVFTANPRNFVAQLMYLFGRDSFIGLGEESKSGTITVLNTDGKNLPIEIKKTEEYTAPLAEKSQGIRKLSFYVNDPDLFIETKLKKSHLCYKDTGWKDGVRAIFFSLGNVEIHTVTRQSSPDLPLNEALTQELRETLDKGNPFIPSD